MLNLFQHPTFKVTCPVGSRNKFGMTLRVNFSNLSWVVYRSLIPLFLNLIVKNTFILFICIELIVNR